MFSDKCRKYIKVCTVFKHTEQVIPFVGGKHTFFMYLQSIDNAWILLVGDMEFSTIFKSSFFGILTIIYDVYHILQRLVINFPEQFPTFRDKVLTTISFVQVKKIR